MQEKQINTRGYEGYETLTSALKMGVRMHLTLFSALIILQIVLFIFLLVASGTPHRKTSLKWGFAKAVQGSPLKLKMVSVRDQNSEIVNISAKDLANAPWAATIAKKEFKKIVVLFVVSCITYLIYPLIIRFIRRRSKSQSGKKYIRGAKLITVEQLKEEFKKNNEQTNLPLGEIQMPSNLENRHTLIIGKPGTGKTQCMRPMLKKWYELGRKGIVYDNKGEYFSEFFDPEKDMLFNPLDQRSLGWNLFNELISYPDVDGLAASLIPPTISNTDPFWNPAARGVFSGILHYLYQNNLRNNHELWKLLTADANEIAHNLKNTKGGEAGYRYITQNAENSKQAEGVLAVMMQYTKCFEYMAGNDGDFQISDWLYNGKGMIYITNYEDIEETLKPVLSLFVDLVGRKILSMPDDLKRRIMFNLDEFGSLQRLSTIVKLLTRGRSKGACIFLGIQDDGQTEKIYTPQIRKSIDNACGNRITFALTGETAEKEARYNIGETEYSETQRSMSMGPHDMRDGVSLSEQKKKELMLLPSEISGLPDLTGLVRLKNYDFVLSKWQWEQAQQNHEPFILRSDLLMENILSSQNKVTETINELTKNAYELNMESVGL